MTALHIAAAEIPAMLLWPTMPLDDPVENTYPAK
jgi:hypothetical protein